MLHGLLTIQDHPDGLKPKFSDECETIKVRMRVMVEFEHQRERPSLWSFFDLSWWSTTWALIFHQYWSHNWKLGIGGGGLLLLAKDGPWCGWSAQGGWIYGLLWRGSSPNPAVMKDVKDPVWTSTVCLQVVSHENQIEPVPSACKELKSQDQRFLLDSDT